MKEYEQRDSELKTIGFNSYAEYLSSSLWQSIRAKVFQCKGRKCTLCGEEANQVHHQRYSRIELLGRKIKYLHPICETCHKAIEFSDTGWKRDFAGVCKKFDDILSHRRGPKKQWSAPVNDQPVQLKKPRNMYRASLDEWLATRPKASGPPKPIERFINISKHFYPDTIKAEGKHATGPT